MEDPLAQFQKLIQLVQNTFHHEKGRKAKTKINFFTAKEAILLAYKLRSDQFLRQLLSQSGKCGIRKLSRYWWYCLELLQCARSMAALRKIEFFAVPKVDVRPPLPAAPSASQDLIPAVNRLLTSMGFTLADLRAYCKHTRLREADLWHGMETSFCTPPYVHAEMTLMYFYALHTDLQQMEVRCSTSTCFACNNPLKNHPSFKAEKSHTEVHPKRPPPAQKPSSKTVVAPTLEPLIMPAFINVLRQALMKRLMSAPQVTPTQFPPPGTTTTVENEPTKSGDTGNAKMAFFGGMRAFILGLCGLLVTENVEDEGVYHSEAGTDASPIPGSYPGKL